MSASEKDLNNLTHPSGNAGGGPVASQDVSGVTYYGHSQSQAPVTLQHTPQSNAHRGPASTSTSGKPPSHNQKPSSSQKTQSVILPANQKPKATPARIAPSQPTTVKPSATTNAPTAPPKSAPTPTPPGSSAVMAAVMAQAQAAAGQAVAAQHAKQQAPNVPAQPPAAPPLAHPVPGQPVPQPYPYPYPYYLPPGQPGAPPYVYPGAPGAPAFLPAGAPAQGAPPYPYMYPMYPAPIPVPQTSPVPAVKEKKSQRTYQACQKCRQWKAKCNGLKPCNHCQKRGVACEYAERRNMAGQGESSQPEQPGSHEEAVDPNPPDGVAGSRAMEAKSSSDGSNAAQPASNLATGIEAAQHPPPQQVPAQPPQQAAPPAGSPPHPAQPPHPHPMAMYPPPPPGYVYPPQIYPGMPFPAPGDPNVPYAHFMGMQYPQPYGPYLWGPPPPPPGHEQAPAANPTEGEEGERDADGKLKIKRTFQACQKCRQRKAKCNGARPSCQHCTSRGLTCEYAKERSKPRGPNGEEGDESPTAQHTEPPTTMDPSQATISTNAASPEVPPMPSTAPPNMFPPPFQYDPNAYNPHVDPQQHGAQPVYPFPPYAYGHPPGFGTIAGPPLVHIGEEGAVATYHPTMAQPVPVPGPPPSNAPIAGPSNKRPRAARPPGAPGIGKVRIFQACERCRERKAKCDGARPVCSHCAARDLNCEWAGKRRMRGPAKGITPRRNRSENSFSAKSPTDMSGTMPSLSMGLATAGLQTIEQHPAPIDTPRKRKRRPSHSSGSPSPSSSSSSSESSPSESDDDDHNGGMGAEHDDMGGVVGGQWS
ncbi:hypothetical protein FRC07_009715 [Ceratobasidium sp. 392]|nr:hypothetical protein FRC07_009715 [Ceratobasidium sp. 392]